MERYLAVSAFDVQEYLTADERDQYLTAEQAEFARIFGTKQALGKVVIEVLGGVAEVTGKPGHIEVEIIDHDDYEDHNTQDYEEQSALEQFLERADMPQE